jgi:hypothetical protein
LNAKLCKRLRVFARAETIGKPYRTYVKDPRCKPYPKSNGLEGPLQRIVWPEGTFKLDPECTRGEYKRLKRG